MRSHARLALGGLRAGMSAVSPLSPQISILKLVDLYWLTSSLETEVCARVAFVCRLISKFVKTQCLATLSLL